MKTADTYRVLKRAKTVVDCTAKPLDVTPVTKLVTDTAKILSGSSQRPWVILVARTHGASTQTLMMAGLIERLREAGVSFGVGLEHPVDRKNLGTLEAAPKSEVLLAETCAQNQVSLRFNDAVRKDHGALIDRNDPRVKDIPTNAKPDEEIDTTSREGVRIRNGVMVLNAMTHMQETGVNLYIQDAGPTHILGSTIPDGANGETFPFAHSMAKQFEDAGINVLVLMQDTHLAGVPSDGLRFIANGICVMGLSPEEFSHSDGREELTHIGAVRQASGARPDVLQPKA